MTVASIKDRLRAKLLAKKSAEEKGELTIEVPEKVKPAKVVTKKPKLVIENEKIQKSVVKKPQTRKVIEQPEIEIEIEDEDVPDPATEEVEEEIADTVEEDVEVATDEDLDVLLDSDNAETVDEVRERNRRIAALDGDSGLDRIRAVSNTKNIKVFEHAIKVLDGNEKAAWKEVFTNIPGNLLSAAIAKYGKKDATIFSALGNKEISDATATEIIEIAKARDLVPELAENLPKSISIPMSEVISDLIAKDAATSIRYISITIDTVPLAIFILLNTAPKFLVDSRVGQIVAKSATELFHKWADKQSGNLVVQFGTMLLGALKVLGKLDNYYNNLSNEIDRSIVKVKVK